MMRHCGPSVRPLFEIQLSPCHRATAWPMQSSYNAMYACNSRNKQSHAAHAIPYCTATIALHFALKIYSRDKYQVQQCWHVHRTHATWMFWKKRDKVRWKNLQEWGEIGRPTLVPSAKVWCWFELFFGNRQHVGKGLGVRRGRKCKKADKKQMKESLEKSIVWSNVLRWGQQQKRRWMEKDFVWDHVKERGEW